MVYIFITIGHHGYKMFLKVVKFQQNIKKKIITCSFIMYGLSL